MWLWLRVACSDINRLLKWFSSTFHIITWTTLLQMKYNCCVWLKKRHLPEHNSCRYNLFTYTSTVHWNPFSYHSLLGYWRQRMGSVIIQYNREERVKGSTVVDWLCFGLTCDLLINSPDPLIIEPLPYWTGLDMGPLDVMMLFGLLISVSDVLPTYIVLYSFLQSGSLLFCVYIFPCKKQETDAVFSNSYVFADEANSQL